MGWIYWIQKPYKATDLSKPWSTLEQQFFHNNPEVFAEPTFWFFIRTTILSNFILGFGTFLRLAYWVYVSAIMPWVFIAFIIFISESFRCCFIWVSLALIIGGLGLFIYISARFIFSQILFHHFSFYYYLDLPFSVSFPICKFGTQNWLGFWFLGLLGFSSLIDWVVAISDFFWGFFVF